jgi:glycosyltransferase involved in cell wall biosynthesis
MRFSIVTISYNQGPFIEETIRSIIGQRGSNTLLEYIVVDAGSTDTSRPILENYKDDIDHLILEPDEGPADGLNKGFQRASGDVFAFINADDLLEPGALDAVRDFLERHPKSQAVTGSLRTIDQEGKPLRLSRLRTGAVLYPPRFTLRDYLDGSTTVLQQSTFFRNSAWRATDGFNPQNSVSWDSELFVDMLLAGVHFDRMPTILASFRVHSESITGSGRLEAKREQNTARIRGRLAGAGIHPSHPFVSAARRLAWRLRPVNRASGEVVRQRARWDRRKAHSRLPPKASP